MKLYTELAPWWPLVSPPSEYAIEAAGYRQRLEENAEPTLDTVLELGCGGGNNASFLKRRFAMTLSDASAEMLAVSRARNPECEHVLGDMRRLRLGRTFDAVFAHDAVEYLTTEADIRAAIATAFAHCRPGGTALFVPDFTAELFQPITEHGGGDAPDGSGIRYLLWCPGPRPGETKYVTEFAIVVREADGTVRHLADPHECGLFGEAVWLAAFADAGFSARGFTGPDEDGKIRTQFVARRPA